MKGKAILSDEDARSASLDAYMEAYNDYSTTREFIGAVARLRSAMNYLSPTFDLFDRVERMAPAQALRIYPEWLLVKSFEAALSQQSGQWTEAHEGFLDAYGSLIHENQHPHVRHWMGLILSSRALRNGNLRCTAALLSEQLQLTADDPSLHVDLSKTSVMLGYVANRLGDLASSSLYYEIAEQGSDPMTAAKALDYAGMSAFNNHDYAGSRALYEKAFKILGDSEDQEYLLQSSICASRLAESCLLSGDPTDAAVYALQSLVILDRLREELAYESARGVGALMGDAPLKALRTIVRAMQEVPEPDLAMLAKALLILANSGLASRVRGHKAKLGVVFVSSGMKTVSESASRRGRLTIEDVGYYTTISEADVHALLNQSVSIMLACIYDNRPTGFDGVTLVCGSGQLNWLAWNVPHECSHNGSHQGDPFDVLNGFLSGMDSDSWNLSSSADVWECLGMNILPTGLRDVLGKRAITQLKIAPIGSLWNFPFHALAIGGSPIVMMSNLTLCAPLGRSFHQSYAPKAVGVFDLSISGALQELKALRALASTRSLEIVLTNRHDQTLTALRGEPAEMLVVSAHGSGIDGDQYILLPDHSLLRAEEVLAISPPQFAILASCHIGRTSDPLTQDPVSIPLALLGRGSNQVLAAIRTIPSNETAKLTAETLVRMGQGSCLAIAFCETVRLALEADPDAPVDSWAALAVVSS